MLVFYAQYSDGNHTFLFISTTIVVALKVVVFKYIVQFVPQSYYGAQFRRN